MPLKHPITGRQRQNAEIRKPEIVRSFYETVLEQGLEGASIAKVAARIQIHPSLILHYFGNKESLTLALVDYVVDEYTRLFENVRLKGLGPEARLEKLLDTVWSRRYYEKIHIASSFAMIAVSFRNPAIHEKIQGLYLNFRQFLIREIRAARQAGVIQTHDPEGAANRIVTLIEGARHFRHFFIPETDVNAYNRDMKTVTRAIVEMKQP